MIVHPNRPFFQGDCIPRDCFWGYWGASLGMMITTCGLALRLRSMPRRSRGGARICGAKRWDLLRVCEVHEGLEKRTSPGLKGLKKMMGVIIHHLPGSSKWPRLDPQVTFSGLKCPPFGESKGLCEEAGIFCVRFSFGGHSLSKPCACWGRKGQTFFVRKPGLRN